MRHLPTFARTHPGWSSFVLLACIMVPFTLFELRNAPMEPGQRFGVAVACVAVAGFCGWVISLATPPSDLV